MDGTHSFQFSSQSVQIKPSTSHASLTLNLFLPPFLALAAVTTTWWRWYTAINPFSLAFLISVTSSVSVKRKTHKIQYRKLRTGDCVSTPMACATWNRNEMKIKFQRTLNCIYYSISDEVGFNWSNRLATPTHNRNKLRLLRCECRLSIVKYVYFLLDYQNWWFERISFESSYCWGHLLTSGERSAHTSFDKGLLRLIQIYTKTQARIRSVCGMWYATTFVMYRMWAVSTAAWSPTSINTSP